MGIIIKNHSLGGWIRETKPYLSIYSLLALILFFNTFSTGCIEDKPSQNMSETLPDAQSSPVTNITENIEKTLVGHQIVYYDIAGEPRNYNISKKDIRSIEESELDGEVVWVVTVGSGMQWEIHLNSTGESILKETQLFRT